MAAKTRLGQSGGWLMLLATGLVGLPAIGEVTFDGSIDFGPGEEWADATAAAQDNYTGFGDQKFTPGGFPGSELDELFVHTDGTYLYVGVTGNLEQNSNAIILLFDTITGGQNQLKSEIAPVAGEMPVSYNGPPASVQGLGERLNRNDNGTPELPDDDFTERTGELGTILDTGFAPDHALAIDTTGGTVSVTQYSPGDPVTPIGQWNDPSTVPVEALDYFATRVFRGRQTVNSGQSLLSGGNNLNGLQVAFNNTNKLGVTGASDTPPPPPGSTMLPGDPRTATTGLEAKIPLADLGLTVPLSGNLTMGMAVLLTSSDGYCSNQTLPPIGAGTDTTSLGFRKDFTTVSGNQYKAVARTTGQFSPFGGTLDGESITTDFNVATEVEASQDTVTGFGDRNCIRVTDGSELDELYMRLGAYDSQAQNQFLYVGVTGNLQGNDNAIVLLVEARTGGQNELQSEISPRLNDIGPGCSSNGPPGAVQGLGQALVTNQGTGATERSADTTKTKLDADFAPNYAVAMGNSNGTLHVSQYDLLNTSQGTWDDPGTPQNGSCGAEPYEVLDYYATREYRGQVGVNSGSGTLTSGVDPNGSQCAFNNTGIKGVTGTQVAAPGSGSPGDPRSQTTGLEAKISLLDLGFTVPELEALTELNVEVSVLLLNSDGLTVSNQVLPGVTNGTNPANLNARPDFTAIACNQYAVASLTPGAFAPVLDGKDIVSEFGVGAGNPVASQDTVTGFGDVHEETVTDCDQEFLNRSELDQMLVLSGEGRDTGAATLDIAISGNLEENGNQFIIFLDTEAGGEALLAGNPDRLAGLNGDTLPMQADYAVLVNMWPGAGRWMYVDLFDLVANTRVYMGRDEISGGNGILTGGQLPGFETDWRVIVDNGNLAGVSGNAGDDPQTAKAVTAVQGFELSIPRSAIGSPEDGAEICVFAVLTGDGGWMSNQLLPALGGNGGVGNYGDGPNNLAALGYACRSFTIGPNCPDPHFDADRDGDVDHEDFGAFQACVTGNGGGILPGCICFDWNPATEQGDGDVDNEDWGAFELCASGPNVRADQNCDNPPP